MTPALTPATPERADRSAHAALPPWAAWALARPGVSVQVDVDGVALHALGWSLGERTRPALVFVHGHRAHAHWWDWIAPFFADTHRVLALDLSGMGDSAHRDHYDRDTGARDIAGLIEALDLGPATVVGHSNGGLRTLGACALAPQRIARAVVIDSYAVFADRPHPGDPPRLRGDRVHADLDAALSRHRLLPEQPVQATWALDHVARHALRPVAGGWRWKFDPAMPSGPSHEWPAEQLLPAVRCPVHVFHGGASVIVDAALAQRTTRLLPQGRGPVVIPDGHHHLMFDQPIALIAALQAALA